MTMFPNVPMTPKGTCRRSVCRVSNPNPLTYQYQRGLKLVAHDCGAKGIEATVGYVADVGE